MEENKTREENCKNLFKQRESLNKTRLQMSDAFDKYLLTFSTGSLALSISFTGSIIQNGVDYTVLLAIGWTFLIISMISILFSFNLSEYAHERQIEIIDSHIISQQDNDRRKIIVNEDNYWTKLVSFSRWLSIFSFISGVILLSIFYFLNLN